MTSVDAARADLEQCERAVVLAREAVLAGEPSPSCFAVFATQKAAAEAAQCLLHSGSRRNLRAARARPDNVNWQTLLYRRHQSLTRIALISPLIAFILLFPSGIFTVGIASACMGDVPSSLDWYCSEDAAGFKIFVSGSAASHLANAVGGAVVSFFLMYCVQAQNVHASLSSTDRRFLRYYYVWGFANVLLGGVTGGALTSFAQDVLGQDNTTYSIQKHLGRILPISSNFFLVFVFFRSVYLPIQRLILPHPGIICWAVRRYLCVFGCAVKGRRDGEVLAARATHGTRSRRVSDGGDAGLDVLSHRAHDGPGVLAVFCRQLRGVALPCPRRVRARMGKQRLDVVHRTSNWWCGRC